LEGTAPNLNSGALAVPRQPKKFWRRHWSPAELLIM